MAIKGYRLLWRGDAVKDDVMRSLAREFERTAEQAVRGAKRYAPVRTGRLRQSLRIQSINRRRARVAWGSDLDYALYQEVGTSRVVGKHYLRRSAREAIAAMLRRMKEI